MRAIIWIQTEQPGRCSVLESGTQLGPPIHVLALPDEAPVRLTTTPLEVDNDKPDRYEYFFNNSKTIFSPRGVFPCAEFDALHWTTCYYLDEHSIKFSVLKF